MKTTKGFTLAELLVVITIIAIIAGILLPVLIQAQDTARMKVCVSNLKQLGVAFRMYLDDNSGYALPGPPQTWDMTLDPTPLQKYLKEPPVATGRDDAIESNPKRVWICPGDHGSGNEVPRWRYFRIPLSSYYYPYGAYTASAGNIDVMRGQTRVNAPRRPELWCRPSKDMLFSDWGANFHRGVRDGSGNDYTKCVNFIMLDGHVIAGTRWDRFDRIPNIATIYHNPYSWGYNPAYE